MWTLMITVIDHYNTPSENYKSNFGWRLKTLSVEKRASDLPSLYATHLSIQYLSSSQMFLQHLNVTG